MEIKVFGPGCARCVEAENVVRQAAEQAGGEISVIKVSDFREIMAARIISTPAVEPIPAKRSVVMVHDGVFNGSSNE